MTGAAATTTAPQAGGGRRRMLLLGGLGLLVLGGAAGGAVLLGLVPLGARHEEAGPQPPVFVDVPEIIANLNVQGRRNAFVRLRSKLELASRGDLALVQAAMPRLIDLFTTFLRETRPEELRGSAGAHRLREELMARANIATRPGAIADVLFVELVVQ